MIRNYTTTMTKASQTMPENYATNFFGHTSITELIVLSCNRIASASYDHTIKFWDIIYRYL